MDISSYIIIHSFMKGCANLVKMWKMKQLSGRIYTNKFSLTRKSWQFFVIYTSKSSLSRKICSRFRFGLKQNQTTKHLIRSSSSSRDVVEQVFYDTNCFSLTSFICSSVKENLSMQNLSLFRWSALNGQNTNQYMPCERSFVRCFICPRLHFICS